MLTSGEINAMRRTAEAAMPNVAEVIRTAHSPDGLGGTTQDEVLVTTCRARLGTVSEQDQATYADKLGGVTGFVIALPAGTDVKVRDRVRFDGRVFEVFAAPDRADWELTRRVIVLEVVQ